MSTWTIGKKLAAGFAAVMAVMARLGTFTWPNVTTIQRDLTPVTAKALPGQKLAERLRYEAATLRITRFSTSAVPEAASAARTVAAQGVRANPAGKRFQELLARTGCLGHLSWQ